jgi:hypothetical protein
MKTVLKLEGRLSGYRLAIGTVRSVNIKLTTPPITNRTAARSTSPCLNGETPFIFLKPQAKSGQEAVKDNSTQWKILLIRRNFDSEP